MGQAAKTKATNTAANAKALRPLGDTELVLLTAGAKRGDRLIESPAGMKAASRQRAAGNLLKRGMAEERPAGRDEPAWREEDGHRIALRVTDAGLAAIGIEVDASQPALTNVADDAAAAQRIEAGQPAGSGPDRPREGSKGALVVGLLIRPEGAGIDELIAATGWLPHTTRAALTGLRRRGYAIERSTDDDGRSRYRIQAEEPKAKPGRGRRRADAPSVAPAAA